MVDRQKAGNILLDGMVALSPNLQVVLQVGNRPGRNWDRVALAPFTGNVEQLLLEVEVTQVDVSDLGDPDPGAEDQSNDGDVALAVVLKRLPGPLIALLQVFVLNEINEVELHLSPVHVGGQGMGAVVQRLGIVKRVDLQHDVAVEVRLPILDVGGDRQELEQRAQGVDGAVDRGRRVQVALGISAVLQVVDVQHDVIAPELSQGVDGDALVVFSFDEAADP